jgi:hypothetical protein
VAWHAATTISGRGSFLTKFFAGGLFWHFTRAGGLMCQKFPFMPLQIVSHDLEICFDINKFLYSI